MGLRLHPTQLKDWDYVKMSRYYNRKAEVLEDIGKEIDKQELCVWYYAGEALARHKKIPYWQRPDFLADYMINKYEESR